MNNSTPKPKPITVRDLKDQTGARGPHSVLFCTRCRAEYSANRGDYFMLAKDSELRCCNAPMRLMIRTVQMKEVRP